MKKEVTKKKKVDLSRIAFILTFIAIPTINFLIFYVYVNLDSILMAFQHQKGGETYWTVENFTRFFKEFALESSDIRLSFLNTFKTFCVNLIMFPIGFLVSYFLYKKIFLANIFRFCFFLPGLIAGTVVASFYMKFVGTFGPMVKLVQKWDGLSYIPQILGQSEYANKAILAQVIWLSFPGSMIIWGGTFSRIPTQILESARLDGVGWLREAVSIIIPIIWPTFAMQLMLTVIGIFGASGNVFLLTNGNFGTQTFANWMYMQVYGNATGGGNANAFSYMSAVGLVITCISIALSLFIKYFTNKSFSEVTY